MPAMPTFWPMVRPMVFLATSSAIPLAMNFSASCAPYFAAMASAWSLIAPLTMDLPSKPVTPPAAAVKGLAPNPPRSVPAPAATADSARFPVTWPRPCCAQSIASPTLLTPVHSSVGLVPISCTLRFASCIVAMPDLIRLSLSIALPASALPAPYISCICGAYFFRPRR